MPTAFTEIIAPPPAPEPPEKLWTRAECEALEAAGYFEGQRYELVQGKLINKMGAQPPHWQTLRTLESLLNPIFGFDFVATQIPIDVAPGDNPINEPEPDLIALKREYREFDRNPQPEEIHLIVEVAHSSLNFDLTTKARLYARAGIAEFWVLDVTRRRLIVHRNPQGDQYQSVVVFNEHERVAPLAAPEGRILVSDAFPGNK